MHDQVSPWLTRIEAARYARVSVAVIDRWAREGKITKHILEGSRSVRFVRADIDALFVPAGA